MRKTIGFIVAALVAGVASATVPTTTSSTTYTCTGATTPPQAFAVPFKFLASGDLVVTKTLSGVTTTLVIGTDYTVTGAGGTSGSVTLTAGSKCASGYTLTIARTVALTQTTSLRSQGTYSPAAVEAALDRSAMQAQQVDRRVAGAEATHAGDKAALDTRIGAEEATRAAADFFETAARGVEDAAIRAQVASAAMSGGVNIADTSTVTATGSTTARSLKDRWADVVNVRDFGAKCDRTTDDTAAIQAAITFFPLNTGSVGILTPRGFSNGGTLHFPRGGCKVTNKISLRRGISLRGEGIESSQILSFTPGSVFQYLDSGRDTPDSIAIEDLSIWQDPSVPATSGAAIDMNTGPATIQSVALQGYNLLVSGTYEGVILQAGIGSSLRNVTTTGTVSWGVHFPLNGTAPTSTTSTTLQNVYAYSTQTGSGFRFEGSAYVTCISCASDSNAEYGYSLDSTTNVSLLSCGAELNGLGGAYLNGTQGTVLSLDVVHAGAGTKHGIVLNNAAGTTLLGGFITAVDTVSGYGINVTAANGFPVVIGTKFAGNYSASKTNTESVAWLGLGGVGQVGGFVGGSANRWSFGATTQVDTASQLAITGLAESGVEKGVKASATFTTAGASRNAEISVQTATDNTAVTYPLLVGLDVLTSTKGAASTVSRAAGAYIAEQTAGTTANANLMVGASAGTVPAGNWSIYSNSTRDSVFVGPVRLGSSIGPIVVSGSGSPEGVVIAEPGSLYVNTAGGASTTLYVKQSGPGASTGWVAK